MNLKTFIFVFLLGANATALTIPEAKRVDAEVLRLKIEALKEKHREWHSFKKLLRGDISKINSEQRRVLHDYYLSKAIFAFKGNNFDAYQKNVAKLAEIILRHNHTSRADTPEGQWGRGLETGRSLTLTELRNEINSIIESDHERNESLFNYWLALICKEEGNFADSWNFLEKINCHRTAVKVVKAMLILKHGYKPVGVNDSYALAQQLLCVKSSNSRYAQASWATRASADSMVLSSNARNFKPEREELSCLSEDQAIVSLVPSSPAEINEVNEKEELVEMEPEELTTDIASDAHNSELSADGNAGAASQPKKRNYDDVEDDESDEMSDGSDDESSRDSRQGKRARNSVKNSSVTLSAEEQAAFIADYQKGDSYEKLGANYALAKGQLVYLLRKLFAQNILTKRLVKSPPLKLAEFERLTPLVKKAREKGSGLESIARELGITIKQVRNILDQLKTSQNLAKPIKKDYAKRATPLTDEAKDYLLNRLKKLRAASTQTNFYEQLNEECQTKFSIILSKNQYASISTKLFQSKK